MSDEKACFVISPIGDLESETRKRSDQVLKHVIRPAVSESGYQAIRADEIDKPGLITSQVLQHVVNDALVVADLTERNPNVFYELAVRHATGKPLIQLMKSGEQIPFDVAQTRTIFVDHRDLDSVADAKAKISEQIVELESDPSTTETPISVSLDLQFLRQSEKPEDRSLAELLATMSDLRADVAKVETRLDSIGDEVSLDPLRRELSRLRQDLLYEGSLDGPVVSSRVARMSSMMEELEETGVGIKGVELLVVASYVRQVAPWVHELALEAFRAVRTGTRNKPVLLDELRQSVDYLNAAPIARELIGRGRHRDMIRMALDFCRHLVRRAQEKYA